MHNNKTLENNCINYIRVKGMLKAQHVIKSSAREYWQYFCSTLHKSAKLGTVWRRSNSMGKGNFGDVGIL